MPWYIYLLVFIIANIFYVQSLRQVAPRFKNPSKGTVLLQIFAGTIALLFIPFFTVQFSTNPWHYLLILIACIFYAITDILYTTVYQHLDGATNDIIAQTTTLLLMLYGFIFLGESTTLIRLIGAFLIIGANILLALAYKKKGNKKDLKYIFLMILAQFTFTTAILIDVEVSKLFNLPLYIAITLFLPALMIIVFNRFSIKEILQEFNTKTKKLILLNAFVWVIMIIGGILSLQSYKMSIVAPLRATTTILNTIVGAIWFKQTDNLWAKIIASLMVVAGIALLFV